VKGEYSRIDVNKIFIFVSGNEGRSAGRRAHVLLSYGLEKRVNILSKTTVITANCFV
jgi:hypothetical protein